MKTTIAKKAAIKGRIANFNIVDKRLFHRLEADSISDAQRSAIRHTIVIMLISDTPTVANMLMADDVALVVLNTLFIVLIIDDNIFTSCVALLTTTKAYERQPTEHGYSTNVKKPMYNLLRYIDIFSYSLSK